MALEKRPSDSPAPDVDDIEEQNMSDNAKRALHGGPPPFRWASLWEPAVVNHLNGSSPKHLMQRGRNQLIFVLLIPLAGKSYTLPILNLRDQYAINFHLAWLGFFVAFLSWFAFPPLIPEAIKADLNLTTAQIGNSNIIALLATLVVRWIIGPFVDRWGPRWTMAGVLIIGSIPSGLAGTISSAGGLYAVRFFIGILGATFVPCLTWTTTFYDKSIVGTANSLVGGWGNLGGGVTFVVQVALYQQLLNDGLSSHSAWRAAFAIVPVPILWFVAIMTLIFGTDHPAGKWSARHTLPATAIAARQGHFAKLDASERALVERKMQEKAAATGRVQAAEDDLEDEAAAEVPLDIAVSEPLTWKSFLAMISKPYTWLPTLTYMTTFGFELAVDANLANVLYSDHKSPSFGQLRAGYCSSSPFSSSLPFSRFLLPAFLRLTFGVADASTFGFLNVITRPLGGYVGDKLYPRFGVTGKKYLTITLGFLQGMMAIAYGLVSPYHGVKGQDGWLKRVAARETDLPFRLSQYVRHHYSVGTKPDLNTQMGLIALMAIFCETGQSQPLCVIKPNGTKLTRANFPSLFSLPAANGACFSLVPHCNPFSNGFVTGLVGGIGNLGGIFIALMFRYHVVEGYNVAWISAGAFAAGVNLLCILLPTPRK
ncbi:SPOSA6832_04310, partial [Sporobolomyces salmonicolor]